MTDEVSKRNDDEPRHLRENELLLRAVFDNVVDALLVADDHGTYLRANAAASTLLGLPLNEIVGRSLSDFTHPSRAREVEKIWRDFLAEGIQKGVFEIERPDGTAIVVDYTAKAHFLPNRHLSVLRDVTERTRYEQALKQSLKEVSDIKFALDESAIVAITDQRGRITYANDQFCEISKYPRAELLGQDHRIINSGYHPNEFISNLWTTITNGKVWHGEIKNRAKDGSFYWVNTTIVPFLNAEGIPYQYVAIRSDITERKRAEERLRESERHSRAVLDGLSAFVSVLTPDGTLVEVNRAALEGAGLKPEDVIGKRFEDTYWWSFSSESKRQLRAAIERAARGETVRYDVRARVAGDRLNFFDFAITPLFDAAGSVSFLIPSGIDITERKRLEAELTRAAQLSLVGELAAGLAHEIKNPLAGIQGAVDVLIERRSPNDPERLALEDVRGEVERIDRTVRALLERARPRSVRLEHSSLTEAVRRAVQLAQYQAAARQLRDDKISIEFESPDDPLALRIDAAQIEDAVLNLLLNAIEAVDGEQCCVTVRLRAARTGARPEAVIEVEDNGRGIPTEDLTRIFNPFFTTTENGTGLGLVAVRRIARAHGGRVEVRSKPGHGSTFTIRLPLDSLTS